MNIKNLVTDISEVPSAWVFERYLKDRLPRKLEGQNEMIKSLWSRDTTPSMSIFVKGNKYKWHDFSIGEGGSKVDLVMKMEKIGFAAACTKIVGEYNDYLLNGNSSPITEFKQHAKYSVTGWSRRKWTVSDRDYWSQYEISSGNLEYFNAFPLSEYEMTKEDKKLTIKGHMIYGYFTASGEIYKIYQPMSKERKFLKIRSYIQGWDQLTEKSAVCIITSSLKDVACVRNLGWMDEIAPDSENTMLTEKIVADLRVRYPQLITLMNHDSAGLMSKQKYEERYQIPGVILPLEKDPSDSVKKHGSGKVKPILEELIRTKLEETLI